MYLLALELSTTRCSVAVGTDTSLVRETSWMEASRASMGLIPAIRQTLDAAALPLERIDGFLAGIGPGTFSGLRVAAAVLQGFALPGRKPVHGIGSPMALAWDAARAEQTDTVTVAGDARRGHYWYARFRVRDGHVEELLAPCVAPRDRWPDAAGESGLLVTADWARIGPALAGLAPGSMRVIGEPRFPSAAAVLAIAQQYRATGTPLPPALPVYLHPPVARPTPADASTETHP